MMFDDRHDAAVRLAQAVMHLREERPVVLALPRGGLPIGVEVARALDAPLDLLLVRKIGAPRQRELAIGAVVDGEQMDVVLNEEIVEQLGVSMDYVRERAAEEVEEIERRRRLYLRGRERVSVQGRTVIVVDDGIATGATVRAALRGLRRRKPAHLVLAVPVAPPDTIELLSADVDEIICLEQPEPFGWIGRFYGDFRQVTDDEVRDCLDRARAGDRDETLSDSR